MLLLLEARKETDMTRLRYLIVTLIILAVAAPALAKKDKPQVPKTMREALEAAPLFADVDEQARGQKILNEACAAMLEERAICDLVIKDVDFAGFYFKPDSGIMLTSIQMLDTLPDEELRAGFAWAIAYADGGLRDKAAKMQKDRFDLLDGLGAINPSVGVGSTRFSGNSAVSVGVGLGPGTVLAIADAVSSAVEDARLSKELQALDAKVIKKLGKAGFEDKGMIKLLKRAQKEGDNYLLDRETGIGRVDQARIKQAKGK